MVEYFKTLSDENRLRMINLLMKYELCVCELEVLLGLSQSNVSRHLSKLKSSKIISSTKDAQWIHYKINEEFLENSKKLVAYLEEEFLKYNVFMKDLKICENYMNSGLNCQDIRCDSESVYEKIRS